MKDPEIYNIFDTECLLARRPSVMIGKNSGLAGIAYWINETYKLPKDRMVDKRSPLVISLKEWIDKEYADGRQTALAIHELETAIDALGGLH